MLNINRQTDASLMTDSSRNYATKRITDNKTLQVSISTQLTAVTHFEIENNI